MLISIVIALFAEVNCDSTLLSGEVRMGSYGKYIRKMERLDL
jgi:hypothetical protein